jgi:hypothetical protein
MSSVIALSFLPSSATCWRSLAVCLTRQKFVLEIVGSGMLGAIGGGQLPCHTGPNARAARNRWAGLGVAGDDWCTKPEDLGANGDMASETARGLASFAACPIETAVVQTGFGADRVPTAALARRADLKFSRWWAG